jgi:hypothetical protein
MNWLPVELSSAAESLAQRTKLSLQVFNFRCQFIDAALKDANPIRSRDDRSIGAVASVSESMSRERR